jgi:hypothetical protein
VRLGDLGERGDGAVELLARVGGRHLHADARRALRHDGVAEADLSEKDYFVFQKPLDSERTEDEKLAYEPQVALYF